MTFDAPAAKALFQALESHAMTLGLFSRVNLHEPENAPGARLSCSITLGAVTPTPAASGLASVSLTVTFNVRIYSPMITKPLDNLDPDLLGATATLLGEYAGNFTLGGLVRDVDPLALRATPAYLDQDGKEFRTMTITLPVVVNDAWNEVA
jgi:hypothetical protein